MSEGMREYNQGLKGPESIPPIPVGEATELEVETIEPVGAPEEEETPKETLH